MATKPKKQSNIGRRNKSIAVPDKLALAKVTAKMLSTGNYQKKLLAFFAPHALMEAMQGLYRNAQNGDIQSIKVLAEIYGLTHKGNGGVNVFVNQQNANISEHTRSRAEGPASFEEIARVLAEEAHSRAALPAAFEPVFEPTPEGPATSFDDGEE